MKKFKEHINESPDYCFYNNTKSGPFDIDAVSFGYYNGVMYVSDEGLHGDILRDEDLEYGVDDEDARSYFRFSGRLWLDTKVISFWEYPSKEKIDDVIYDLSKALHNKLKEDIDLWQFKIEIVGDENIDYIYDPDLDSFSNNFFDWEEAGRNASGKFVSVSDYTGSKPRSKEELSIKHTKSPLLKKDINVPDGVGSKKMKKFKDWQKPFESKLNESPDYTLINGEVLRHSDEDSYAFGYYKNKMYVTDHLHDDILSEVEPNNDLYAWQARVAFKYAGRLWLNHKVISFWVYPPENEMSKVIRDLENAFQEVFGTKINILNDPEFKIEIVDKRFHEYGVEDSEYIGDWEYSGRRVPGIIVPLSKYTGSAQRSQQELRTQHELSPLKKSNVNIPKGFGSKKDKKFKEWQKPFEGIKTFESFKVHPILVYIPSEEKEWQLLDELDYRNIDVEHSYEGDNFNKGILTIDAINVNEIVNVLDFLDLKYNY